MKQKIPIAVVGMAGLFPGASDLNVFWQNMIRRQDAVCEVPEDRWIVPPDAMIYPAPMRDKALSKRACLIRDFRFDPKGFDMDPNILKELDPLYHIVLHTGREAFAGCVTSSLNKERIGVILAAIALPTDASSAMTRNIFEVGWVKPTMLKNHEASQSLNNGEFHPLEQTFEVGWVKPTMLKNHAASRSLNNGEFHPLEQTFEVGWVKPTMLKNHAASRSLNNGGFHPPYARVTGFPAAILAKSLGLGGGSFTLDAACASSLYAVKLACDELQSYRADAMLAGGVSRPECLYTQVGFSQLLALSRSGRCAPFDESADGLVVGEGAGILVLKRLEDALRDGDTIHGIIRGIGLSNDMRGNLLAPETAGQVRAMLGAYSDAGWSPDQVDLIECHGTGTPVGDAAELRSLCTLWGETGWKTGQCGIGSVKSMIGHLLTAAGAAGIIKIMLALKYKTLPPSLHFEKASCESPLSNSPFRVQTQAQEWNKRDADTPRRAAVSAFGFGGINAHLLIEEFQSVDIPLPLTPHLSPLTPHPSPIAVIGMEAVFGSLTSLREFQEAVFRGESVIRKRPAFRWKGADDIAERILDSRAEYGAYMESLSLHIGEFHIPPNEIGDILPQQLLMLKTAATAMKDAGLPLREERPRMGVIIGMEFDMEATNFHLRWNLHNVVKAWKEKFNLDESSATQWLEALRDSYGPPLTAARTVGALGGIVASRIAREFRFGGPSFGVSDDAGSGMKAMEIAVRLLQQNEADAMLVGAVDLFGDVRTVISTDSIRPFSRNHEIRPFDDIADGTLPGEGSAALVLKRLNQAEKDKDRIYAVIRGIGNSGGGGTPPAYPCSLKRAFDEAGDISPDSISYIETHGSGCPSEDQAESSALGEFFPHSRMTCALGSVKANVGHSGASAALASVVKTALCLYHEIIPPFHASPPEPRTPNLEPLFHLPAYPQYWFRDRKEGPRRACVSSITIDGNCSHAILEGIDSAERISSSVIRERKRPAGFNALGLFIIEGNNKNELMEGIDNVQLSIVNSQSVELAARNHYLQQGLNRSKKYAVSIVANDFSQLEKRISEAKHAILSDMPKKITGTDGIAYSPNPIGRSGEIAFVFPGSGNHYLGMGRGIGIHWPEILRQMDAETLQLKTQIIPECYMPWRNSWEPGWESEAYKKLISDPLYMIFGQVVHGGVVTNLVRHFGVNPSAVIGYSLGESAGMFALGAWPERGEMLKRMSDTNLFSTELAGPCHAARKAWNIPEAEAVNWCAAVVNRAAETVRQIIFRHPFARLLIVNTPEECVIGGRKAHVEAVIRELRCEAIFLDGVVTVHCDAALPAANDYKALHVFPTNPPEGIRFYSCAGGKSYPLTSDAAASSILQQALTGFDFPATIQQAYSDGVRIFLEMGPQASCTRMIGRILDSKPHLAVSADARGEDDYLTMLKFLGTLIAERVPVDLDKLYGDEAYSPRLIETREEKTGREIRLMIGGEPPSPPLPPCSDISHEQIDEAENKELPEPKLNMKKEDEPVNPRIHSLFPISDLMGDFIKNIEATADAHKLFLNFSDELTQNFGKAFAFQTQLLAHHLSHPSEIRPRTPNPEPRTAFDRDMCMEFAVGSVAKVLGPEFAVVDTYKVRVRLPDEPLMLADRILSVEGEKASLSSGRVVTEHDVFPGAWYLDGDRAPVCISVEAGQADLFLCSYLGIDLAVKGKRSYRLLDAAIRFHRGLPRPGDVIRYEIEIEKFVRQGETYLFFFHFEGFIGEEHLITMRNGCAGFFTEEEVRNSGGIILTEEDTKPVPGKRSFDELVPLYRESYDDAAVESLRHGNLAGCFGHLFEGIQLAESLWLPKGRMRLIDRVLLLDPEGGRYGIGLIRAETDIHPDDWFLTCHFVDDKVMPGTLMYECCAHTLRVLLLRMGWVTDKPGVCYEPLIGTEAVLKCRGPVTPETKHVIYEVELKEIGYTPEPYVIADAHMYADGHRIVMFKDMSMKLTGNTKQEIESLWKEKRRSIFNFQSSIFNRERILAFAVGKPSEAFGEPYTIFDEKRVIARLPGPPYFFMDRVVSVEPEPWVLKPGGWIEAEYDVPENEWYFNADRSGVMPFCILLEIALQPCGWLAGYTGSALRSERDLKFRNLGGSAVLYRNLLPEAATLTMRSRMTQVSESGGMIIENFDMQVLQGNEMIYEGTTYFGFFSKEALSQQIGIRGAKEQAYLPSQDELARSHSHLFQNDAPLSPDDPNIDSASAMAMPAKALRMIDSIKVYVPDGGPHGLGFIRGVKNVDPDEWFFKAHFYQDPVCPGSLGIESFLQLIKFMALDRWKHLRDNHRFELVTKKVHNWVYRGQVIQSNRKVDVEAVVIEIQDEPVPAIFANGYLKVDGLFIYQMENFGLRLVKV